MTTIIIYGLIFVVIFLYQFVSWAIEGDKGNHEDD
jgi:hypothetical protein